MPVSQPGHLIDESYLLRYRLQAGNLQASTALCALWKDLERVTFSSEELQKIALVGNLYTMRGLSLLLRSLWRLPSVRHLALWGPDTQHTGRALMALWQQGLNDDHTITGFDARLDPSLPGEAIHHLRQSVSLHDLRGIRSQVDLIARIGDLEPMPPHGPPRVFPETDPEVPETLPSVGSGWQVTDSTVAAAWTRLIGLVMRFGVVRPSQYEMAQRELLNLLAVVTDEDPERPHLPDYLPLNADTLQNYLPRIVEDVPADDLSYTYGNRLRGYFGRDQVELMVDKLRKAPHSRRAIAVLWDPRSDPERETPPCLTQVAMSVRGNQLYLTYTARSQDMFSAWPQNTLGMRVLQSRVAAQLGLDLGALTSHTVSAHIYQHDWDDARRISAQRFEAHQALEFDPQGSFAIRVEDNQIVIELVDPGGRQVLWQSHGANARKLGLEVAALRLVSDPSHYVYVGRELQRAEEALRCGEPYVQGRA